MSATEIPEGIDPETGEVLEPEHDPETEAVIEEFGAIVDTDAETEAEPDDGEGDGFEEDDAPPSTPGATEYDVEKNTKAMNRAADAYIKKVVATLGDDLSGMQTCPLCADSWPGIRFPSMPSPEHLAHVRVAIGLEPGDNLPKDNYSRPCESCDGWGFTDSGSKVPGQSKLTCYDCSGKGWKAVGDERASGAITVPANGVTPVAPVLQDNASNEPPEAAMLKALGYVVVAPIAPVDV